MKRKNRLLHYGLSLLTAGAALFSAIASAQAADKKPNILVLWGDDIGTWNISHNNRGMMGYQTPNIDRIAKEGVGFTDYYAQQSCTAGRSAFLSGSVPVRNGMTKVGLPGAKEGWKAVDYAILPFASYVGRHLATYVAFPPRQKAGTFGLEQVLEKLQQGGEK